MNNTNKTFIANTEDFDPMTIYIASKLESALEEYKKHNGFFNAHNDQMDTCPAIGITADGTIFPLYNSVCTMNPLNYSEHKEMLRLSTSAFNNFTGDGESLEASVLQYNQKIMNNHLKDIFYKYMIVGFIYTQD